MIRLILMRHGNTFEKCQIPVQIGLLSDFALTDYGKSQAKQMANFLNSVPPEKIFSGSLKRQEQTARVIAHHLNLPIEISLELNEIDYGLWEGLTSEAIREKWPKEQQDWLLEGIGYDHIFNENIENRRKSLHRWIKSFCEDGKNKRILAVTSGGILRLLFKEHVKTGNFCEIEVTSQ